MANEYAVNRADLKVVAEAIRNKSGASETLVFPNGFVDSINAIEIEADIVDGLLQGTLSGAYYNDRVTSIRGYAFYYNKNIVKIDFPLVTEVGGNAFADCDALLEINLPLLNKTGLNTFYGCDSLKTVYFPSLTKASASDFSSCKALETAIFEKLKSVPTGTFAGCDVLTALILKTETVCSLASTNAFNNTPIANGTGFVYVPDNLVDSYKTATNWVTYADQIKGISELEV